MSHQDYVFYSYALSALGLIGLVVWSIIRARRAKAALKKLEADG